MMEKHEMIKVAHSAVSLKQGQRVSICILGDASPAAAAAGVRIIPATVHGARSERVWLVLDQVEPKYPPFKPQGRLLIMQARAGDARYLVQAEVVFHRSYGLVLHLVGDWRRLDHRSDPRCDVDLVPVEAQVLSRDGTTERRPMRMLNVSAGGALLLTDRPIAVGDQLRCRFALNGVGAFEFAAKVVRVQRSDDHWLPGLRAGVQFSAVDQPLRKRLADWVIATHLAGRHEKWPREDWSNHRLSVLGGRNT